MPKENYLLGYLCHFLSPQRGYYAGLLVTDIRGVPREFRHTEAVKPNRTQVILYGDSLETSLGTDALAPALYDALTTKPDLLLVDKQSRAFFGSFLLQHRPAAMLTLLADRDLAFNDQEFELKGSPEERVYAYIEDNSDQKGSSILNQAQRSMNLVSPFDRVRLILAEVSQSERVAKS